MEVAEIARTTEIPFFDEKRVPFFSQGYLERKGKIMHSDLISFVDLVGNGCVDKLADELDTFQNLIAEADQISKEWDFVITKNFDT